jgi:hypothetical protein
METNAAPIRGVTPVDGNDIPRQLGSQWIMNSKRNQSGMQNHAPAKRGSHRTAKCYASCCRSRCELFVTGHAAQERIGFVLQKIIRPSLPCGKLGTARRFSAILFGGYGEVDVSKRRYI